MFSSLIGFIAVIALFVITTKQQRRLNRVEAELDELRALGGEGIVARKAQAQTPTAEADQTSTTADTQTGAQLASDAESPATEPESDVESAGEQSGQGDPGPWGTLAPAAIAAQTAQPAEETAEAGKRDIETALGTRWAVWVGGIALAFGGLFLVRYSIESGMFGPGVRLTMAAILGLVMAGGGEFIRRTGFTVPVKGIAGAYIPAILTAAAAFTLFGTVYAAHGVYGFIGPAFAFVLMGFIGIGTIVAALVHGQALAGIGLLGALATPMLVASQAPNPWALFGYLAIVLAATGAIARIRRWSFLMTAAFIGTGLWTLLYAASGTGLTMAAILFICAVMLAVLVFLWLPHPSSQDAANKDMAGDATPGRKIDWPSIATAFFLALSALVLFEIPGIVTVEGAVSATIIIAAMIAGATYRSQALALLHAAGIVTALVFLHMMPVDVFLLDLSGTYLTIDSLALAQATGIMQWIGTGLGCVFAVAGFWSARRHVASGPVQSASWAFWAVAVPLVVLTSAWITFGNIDHDLTYAAIAAIMLVCFVAGAEWIARAEKPPLTGGGAISFSLLGASVAALLMLHMAFGSGFTTVLLGAAAIVPALATRWRSYPVLGWLSCGAATAVICRIAFDPTIVGAEFLSTTPVFNWLLAGYGIPALAFGFAAWQLARTTNGRPRLVMEAAAALFALLTLAMLVRHAMHGGVIDAGAPTLAEQAIYTLIAIGAGAILIAIDMRSPSSVLRYGSMAAGVVSFLFIVSQHFLLLNPLFTDESTGGIPVFNLLFLAFLLPALAAGALALYARGKRPRWYTAMLALVASLLIFAYATLSVRRLFKGEFIGLWSGMEQLETYSYSALWLAMGVLLLVAGVWMKSQVLRIASAALIAIAVLKVFLFDMSELEGVLRAFSFIGLGIVLIGIGLFYQRLLTRAARAG